MKIKDKIFLYIQKLIDGDLSPSIGRYLLKGILLFVSFLFRFVVFTKNSFYDFGILKQSKVKPFVISVGNIVAGGTGKTPFVIYLANKLIENGLTVAVVSRGYGRKVDKDTTYISRVIEDKIYSAKEMGDEPYLIAKRVKQAYVIVNSDKVKAAQEAERLNVDVILLDDGFQSRKLKRDIDIVLLDGEKPFSNKYFIPRGLLRESPKSLKRADLLVFTNTQNKEIADKEKCKTEVPSIYSAAQFSAIKDIFNNKIKIKISLQEKKIAVFSAIAKPYNFHNMLSSNGFDIISKEIMFDHSSFDISKLQEFVKNAKNDGAKAVICTEKDIVKIPTSTTFSLPLYYLEINHKIIFGEEILEELLQIMY